MTTDLAFLDEQLLNEWVVGQRWFASKTREVSSVDAATADPSAETLAAVGTAVGPFTSAVETLINDVQDTC